MEPIEILGWAGSACTLLAYAMKTMLPLRIAAVASSVFFICYTGLLGIWPMLALELLLLPFNLWRMTQILRLRRKVTAARTSEAADFSILKAYSRPRPVTAGAVIFACGDRPDRLYYIDQGEIELVELGLRLGPGQIFGEISFFTDAKARTATARCVADGRIHAIDETTFLKLYFQDPGFGLAVMKLITRRLVENARPAPQGQAPATADA